MINGKYNNKNKRESLIKQLKISFRYVKYQAEIKEIGDIDD